MRRPYFIIAILVICLAWIGPLPHMASNAFHFHMTMHMLVVALASPLFALAISGTSLDPSSKFPAFFSPLPSSLGELIVVWGWHAPLLHHYARHEKLGLILEQLSFFLVGLWFWISVLSPAQRGPGIIGLLLTAMHMTFLGALLALAPRVLYMHHSLEEQQFGGIIMVVFGGAVYLFAGICLTYKMIQKKEVT